MKHLKRSIGVISMLIAIIMALSTTNKTQAASKGLGKKVVYCWIKYDCNATNPQPVNGPNNFRLAVDSQPPYIELECADQFSKCAVKFDFSNTQLNPSYMNSRVPIDASLELQIIQCTQP